jgi:hypothetical protein
MNSIPKVPIVFVLSTILLLLFLGSAPTTLPDADAGEFIILAKHPGIAHPPGFPLYVGLLRLVAAAQLPGSLVFQLTVVSIVSAVGAAAVLFHLFRMLNLAPLWSALGIFAVFTAPGIWRVANTTEPFAFTLLLIALALWVSFKILVQPPLPMRPFLGWFAVLGALYGMGLASHHLMVLYAPLSFVCLCVALSKRPWGSVPAMGTFALGFVLGASPILTLFQDDTGSILSWGPIKSWRALWSHLIREDYGTLTLSASDEAKHGAVRFFWTELPFEMGFVFFLFLVLGLWAALSVKASKSLTRPQQIFSWALLGTLALIGFGFYSQCNVNTVGMGETIVRRFFHAAYLPLAYFIARGLQFQFEKLSSTEWIRTAFASLVLFCAATQVFQQQRIADRSTENFAERDVWNIFQILSDFERPILVTFSDAEILAAFYGQSILGLGKDVTVLHPAIWVHGPYRRKVLTEMGLDPKQKIEWAEAVKKVGNERPVLFTAAHPDIANWPGTMVPRVRLLHWYPEKAPRDLKAMTDLDMGKFAYALERPAMGSALNGWEANLFSRYENWYRTMVNAETN